MRLGIQLIDSTAQLNQFKTYSQIKINQGESINLTFQFVDLDQSLRYVPSVSAQVLVEIPRLPEAFGTASNTRVFQDFSVRRYAMMPFPNDDRSIWQLPLLAADTKNMMSSNLRVTLIQGSTTLIALLPQAIYLTRAETT